MMKTYEQWSARGKQLGWSENATSQAAYQGYVNKFDPNTGKLKTAQPAPQPSSPAPTPLQPAPTPSPQPQSQVQELQNSVSQLQQQIQSQSDAYESQLAEQNALAERMKPRDASQALNNTILTSPFGAKERKKQQTFLTPFGG